MSQEQLLLEQEVTNEELHEILRRLGEQEFALSGQSRVGDIVEATGASPRTIGMILGNIRKEDWEERFGLRVGKLEREAKVHQEKIADHEARIRRQEADDRDQPVIVHARMVTPEMLREHERNKEGHPVFGLVMLVIFGIIVWVMFSSFNAERRKMEDRFHRQSPFGNSHFSNVEEGVYIDGKRADPAMERLLKKQMERSPR